MGKMASFLRLIQTGSVLAVLMVAGGSAAPIQRPSPRFAGRGEVKATGAPTPAPAAACVATGEWKAMMQQHNPAFLAEHGPDGWCPLLEQSQCAEHPSCTWNPETLEGSAEEARIATEAITKEWEAYFGGVEEKAAEEYAAPADYDYGVAADYSEAADAYAAPTEVDLNALPVYEEQAIYEGEAAAPGAVVEVREGRRFRGGRQGRRGGRRQNRRGGRGRQGRRGFRG